jgi:prolyl-tRNA synthetase
VELAEALPLIAARAPATEPLKKTATPNREKCEAVAELLGLPLARTVKSIVLAVDRREPVKDGSEDFSGPGRVVGTDIWLLLIRGDHELNEVKAGKVPGLEGFRFASEAEIVEHFGSPPGYLGPIGTAKPVKVVADRTVANMSDFVCGANEEGFHYTGVNWGRDLPEPVVADIRNVQAGDPSPDGKGALAIQRGIEVGHVFYLGTKYSEAMSATFIDEDGKSKPFEMGCYGIGVTRLVGAAIEQNHDERGIVWPRAIAPFEVAICPLGYRKSEKVRETADALYAELLAAGVDAILDDRDERPGAMFADWELVGVPLRVTIGERSLNEGKVELLARRGMQTSAVSVGDAVPAVRQALAG